MAQAPPFIEVNFDGLVGPTHNFAGLSFGNVASDSSAGRPSYPKAAAKQGLAKMKLLADMGFTQGILPPQERPNFQALGRLGFTGSESQIINKVARQAPHLLAAVYSAASMWTANAATVSPSMDCSDGKVHITPANLVGYFHRSLESEQTAKLLKTVFPDERVFHHHQPLPATQHFGDEGAANHMHLTSHYDQAGLELFVFGKYAFAAQGKSPAPKHFPARQSYEAAAALARLHQLRTDKTLLIQQNPAVIDSGVFHNDVIAVSNQNVLFYHEQAYLDSDKLMATIAQHFNQQAFYPIKVEAKHISVSDAVSSYLFNSQLLSLPGGGMLLLCPSECQENSKIVEYLSQLLAEDNPICQIKYINLKQSMHNGGGPACLRLRMVLNKSQREACHPDIFLNEQRYDLLEQWIDKHYREILSEQDLKDPQLAIECRTALDELSSLLKLGSVYSFQQ